MEWSIILQLFYDTSSRKSYNENSLRKGKEEENKLK